GHWGAAPTLLAHGMAAAPAGPRVQASFGDLDVSGNLTIAPPTGHQTYYQGGDITILPGGHLTLVNTSLMFVEFVGTVGNVSDRLNHIYGIWDYGNLTLVN